MQPILSIIPGAAQSPSPVSGVREPRTVQHPEKPFQEHPQKPVMDEYVPKEKPEPTGRYWLDRGEDGTPQIRFDDPSRAESPETSPESDAPEDNSPIKKAAGNKEEKCTGNTDKVDREIKKLKEKQKALEQQLRSETDDTKIKELERKLAQVESELRLKDNDTYRRQNTVFS